MNTAQERWIGCAEEVAREVLAGHAADVDRTGGWPAESVAALSRSGLLGLTVAPQSGGAGEGPRTFAAVTRTLAGGCASTAMVVCMHYCGTAVIEAGDVSR